MRILNLVTTCRPFFDGQVAELETRGVETTTVEVPGRESTTDTEGRSLLEYARYYPTVLAAVVDGEYDLVHANYGLTAPFALAQPIRPVVCSLWGSDIDGQFGWLSRRCARHCDEVIAVSEPLARQLPCEAHVVPHGVDTELFRPLPMERARTRVGWRQDAAHVLFPYAPGRTLKNYPLAERVVERVREAIDRPVELQVVVDEDHELMPWYMAAADALLLTSRREGSPNAVREALACGLPVIATGVGDVPRMLEGTARSRTCGNELELATQLRGLLEEGGGEQERGRGAQEPSRNVFTRVQMGDRILEIYKNSLGDC